MFDWYSQSPNPDELYHFGRLGMKWGKHIYGIKAANARRKINKYYSTKDGPLERKSVVGVTKGSEKDVIETGTVLRRVSSEKEENHSKRIYATPSDKDFRNYQVDAMDGLLWSDKMSMGNMFEHNMSAIKPIQVAKGKDVVDYIVDKYGDDNHKKVQKFLDSIEYDKWSQDLNYFRDKKASRFYNQQLKVSRTLVNDVMKDNNSADQVYKEFKKRGYDAITDPYDGYAAFNIYDYPVILLNPKKTVKTNYIYDIYRDEYVKSQKKTKR